MNLSIPSWALSSVVTLFLAASAGIYGYGKMNARVDGLEKSLAEARANTAELRAEHDALHEQFTEWRIEASEGRGKAKAAGVKFHTLHEDVRDDIEPQLRELLLKYKAFVLPVVRQEIRDRGGVWPAVQRN